MKELDFDEVVNFIEDKYNVDHRRIEFNGSIVDFWDWLFNAFNFLEDERVSSDYSYKGAFILNFDDKINTMNSKYQSIIQTLSQFNNQYCLKLINQLMSVVNKTSTIDVDFCKNATSEDDFQFLLDEGKKREYIENTIFYQTLQRNKEYLAEDLNYNNPQWVIDFVSLIDKHFSNFKDDNGNYHFKITFE